MAATLPTLATALVQFSFCFITGTAPGGGQAQTAATYLTLSTGILNTTATAYSATGTYYVGAMVAGAYYTPSTGSVGAALSLYPVGAYPYTYINGYRTYNDNQFTINAGSSLATTGNGLAFSSSSLSLDLYLTNSINCNGGPCGSYGSLQVQLYNATSGMIACQPISSVVQFSFCFITGTAPGGGQAQTAATYLTLSTGILNTTATAYSATGTYYVGAMVAGAYYTPSTGSVGAALSLYPVGAYPYTYINGYRTYNDNQFTINAGSSLATTGNGLAFSSSSLSLDLYLTNSINCNGGPCGSYGSLQVQLYNATSGMIACQPHTLVPFVLFSFCFISGTAGSGAQTTATFTSVAYGFFNTSSLNYTSSGVYTVTGIINGYQYTSTSTSPAHLTLSALSTVNGTRSNMNDNSFTLAGDGVSTTSESGLGLSSAYSTLDFYDGRNVRCVTGVCGAYGQLTVQLFNGTSKQLLCSVPPAPPAAAVNTTSTLSSLLPAPFAGRVAARGIQQSLYSNPYLPYLFLIGGQGTFAATNVAWQSLDGGVTWSPLGSDLTLSAIPTFMGAAVALLSNGVIAIYGGLLSNGSATSYVVTTSTLFATLPTLYTAPFLPRYNHACTTLPGTNTTLFCGGISTVTGTATNDCWRATQPELGAVSWQQQTPAGPFPSGLSNAAMVTLYDFNATLLLCGGAVTSLQSGQQVTAAINLCWVSSTLGVSWSAAIPAPWGPRQGLVMVSDLQDWAYLYGGQSEPSGLYYYDLWLSTDRAQTWLPVTVAGVLDIQQGCLALYYTQRYVSGQYVTYPQLIFYSGYQPSLSSYVAGGYFLPLVESGGGSVTGGSSPPLPQFSVSLPLVTSECQFTFNVAGTLAGFGVSSANPNAALLTSYIASLVGAVLGVPASAVQVCVHVTYAYLTTQRGEVYLFSSTLGSVNLLTLVANLTAATGIELLSTPTSTPITSAGGLVGLQSASLCVLAYSLPGTVDYPYSVATSLTLTYDPTFVHTGQGTAVQLFNGTGRRTFTNRFGVSFSTTLSLTAVGGSSADNLLYLTTSGLPVDSRGLIFSLSAPVQLPGGNPSVLTSQLTWANVSGVLAEVNSSRVDAVGTAVVASIPGFPSTSIPASNLNALAADVVNCQALITFTNGLRPPTEPNTANGGTRVRFTYQLSDGANYTVFANLTLVMSSAFATTQDMLGNPYQIIVNVTGTRTYTHLPTRQVVSSTVTGLTSSLRQARFYPYSLLAAAPGVYSTGTAPFFDAAGVTFSLNNTVPTNGYAPGIGPLSNSISLYEASNQQSAMLTEAAYIKAPVVSLQQQTYAFM